MKSLYWIKSWIDRLDDPRFGTMPDWLFRRFYELELVAGEHGKDGLLPPVTWTAWRLRLDEAKLSEALTRLKAVGVVHQDEAEQWWISDFPQTQAPVSDAERARRSRQRQKVPECNVTYRDKHVTGDRHDYVTKRDENVTGCDTKLSHDSSVSESASKSDLESSDLESILDSWDWQPKTPKQAVEHPALQIFQQVSGGLPGERDYNKVIQWVILIARKFQLQPQQLPDYLAPYCLAWTSQIGQNGRNYDPLNVNWLLQAYNQTPLDARPKGQQDSRTKPLGAIDKIEQEIREKGQAAWKTTY